MLLNAHEESTNDRPLFSSRMGKMDPNRVAAGRDLIPRDEFWKMRHCGNFTDARVEPPFRCRCSDPGRERCVQRATQEDRLCTECRDYCWAVRDNGEPVRYVDVPAWSISS